MNRRELKQRADSFLRELTDRLSAFPRSEIAKWPDFPLAPNVALNVPEELASYRFSLMKDATPDGRIRVAVQRYRHRFLGIGQMTADGFFVDPNGTVTRFTQKDIWQVT